MPDIEAMLDSLPVLSAQDLRALHDRAAILLAVGGPAKRDKKIKANDFGQFLYDALGEELLKRVKAKSAPYHIFLRTGTGKRFEQAAVLADAAHQRWYRVGTSATLVSMTRMYAELLLDYLASCSLPFIWDSITWAVTQLPMIVDMSFPGYAESGLLDMVQQLRTRGGPVMT